MTIGGHRGLYNSAYLGSLMALMISPFLSLAGFYLVKNAIDRDIQNGRGTDPGYYHLEQASLYRRKNHQ